MRPVLIALLAANILVAVSFLVADQFAASEPDPARNQLNADKIRVLASGRDAVALLREQPKEEAKPAAPLSCATWGTFPQGRIAEMEARLASLDLGARLVRNEGIEPGGSYLVLIPPIANRPDLNRRVAELSRSGVEYFVFLDGELKGGISLGLLKTEEAANRLLNQVNAKGVNDAVIHARGAKLTTFAMKDLADAERANLEALAREFSGAALKVQACAPPPETG